METTNQKMIKENCFNVLIVDDAKDIHTITINAFYEEKIYGKPLHFISAYNVEDAIKILKEYHKKLSVVLLDIVLKDEGDGLQIIDLLRKELKNQVIQIVIRSGYTGRFPMQEIINDYYIHDYIKKGKTSVDQLYVSVKSAIRTLMAIINLEQQVNESNIELEQIFNVSTPLIQIKKNYTIIKANDSLKTLFQIEGELVGKNCHETLGCLKHGTNDCSVYKLTNKKIKSTRYEAEKTLPDGTELVYEVNAIPIKDEKGKITSVVENIVDITKLKKAEEKIKKDRNKLRALIDNFPGFIYIKDEDSKFIIANEKLYTVCSKLWKAKGNTDKLPQNLIGFCDHDFYPEKRANGFLKDDFDVIITGKSIVNKLEKGLNENLKEIKVLTTKVQLKNDIGEIIGLVGIGRDITEIKKNISQLIMEDTGEFREIFKEFEQKVEKAKTEVDMANAKAKTADERNKLKSEFLSHISHDVRTPINSILLNTEIIKKGYRESEFSANLDSIEISSSVLIDLIDDILTFSVLQEGKLEINDEPTNVASIIKEIKQIFKIPIENKGLNFLIETDENLPGSLLLDQKRIRQILINLLSNAQKYTEQGEIKLITKIEGLSEDKADLIFEVWDTGKGIPENKKKAIFNAFEVIHKGQSGGIGLGLSIVKQLAEVLGGGAEVDSVEGQGSKFTINLPFVKLSDKQPKIFMKFETENIVFEEGTLLIADDTDTVRQNINRIFEGTKIEVVEALNGQEAIEIIKDILPDLVLMDISMPVMDGLEAVKIIKADESINSIPIIAYTASQKRKELGDDINIFDGYISKTNKDVSGKIYKVLQKHIPYIEIDAFDYEKDFSDFLKKLKRNKKFKADILELYVSWNEFSFDLGVSYSDANEFGIMVKKVGNKYGFEPLIKYGDVLSAINEDNCGLIELEVRLKYFLEIFKISSF